MEALEFGLIAVVGIKYCEFYIDEWLKESIQWIFVSFCKKPNDYGLISIFFLKYDPPVGHIAGLAWGSYHKKRVNICSWKTCAQMELKTQ